MSKIWKRNWGKITLLSIVVLLVIARLMLPYFVTKYVNKVLADLDGYTGKIDDVDIALIRGAYVIQGLQIDKTGGNVPVPFVKCEAIDLSVEWRALLHMQVKAEVELEKLVLNFVSGPTKETSQSGKEADWTEALDKLLPIQVNRFAINNGTITYKDFHTDPKANLFLNDLQVVATNLSNIVDKQKALPSSLYVSASSIGNGNLLITGALNVLKKIPDADLNVKFTDVDLTSLNAFTKAYAKFDFEKGQMSLFSEMALADGKIDGYVKPILNKVKVLNWSEEEEPALNKLWQGVIGVTEDVFKNHKKDQFATKVEIHGDLNKTETDVWDAVINILRNGFIEAFQKKLDESVDYKAALSPTEKKEVKKEERKERREERKEERKAKREARKEAHNASEEHKG
ncbi:MAG: hypothetical protein K0R51_1905 [Cytophagaceae bacterium]|jgi:uncharacterized protein YhdP|nr:hypothetical protein [Cytophagaceae bacterium]